MTGLGSGSVDPSKRISGSQQTPGTPSEIDFSPYLILLTSLVLFLIGSPFDTGNRDAGK